ncbi:MAG: hypothetical protein ACT4PU_09080 [Planctomycetota bacterium]
MLSAAQDFLPAADETWRLQRGDDAECRHFQAMANQGHYGSGEPEPGSDGGTRQGIYACAPSGVLLGSVNALDPASVLTMLESAQSAWAALPEAERWLPAGAGIAPAHRWEWSYPEGGLVLQRTVRDLPASLDPQAEPARPSNRDFVWFSAEEARALVPADARPGRSYSVPRALLERLVRFHLVDNVRGQTLPFSPRQVAAESEMHVQVLVREGTRLTLQFRGATRAEDDGRPDPDAAPGDWAAPDSFPRTVSATLLGLATYDLDEGRFLDFELVALGERRGSGWLNNRRAEEAGPIGWVFSLAPDDGVTRIPPAFIDLYEASWIQRPGEATPPEQQR